MPRRKASEANLPRKARTRSGCLTCRQRKVKCDERKPACQRCIDSGHRCEHGLVLKWQEEFADRGAAFGRLGVWKKNDRQGSDVERSHTPRELSIEAVPWCQVPIIESHHFINGTFEEFQGLLAADDIHVPGADESSQDPTPSAVQVTALSASPRARYLSTVDRVPHIPLLPSLPALTHLNGEPVSDLLQYYVTRLCPLTTPNQSKNSPFATIVLPFALSSSPDVLRSILALSACHRCKTDPSWNKTALQLKGGVLQFLRQRLGSKGSIDISQDPEVLTITMIMCLYEIINECDERWVVYLRGARDIIRIRKQLQQPLLDLDVFEPVFAFAERFFAYQDVLGRTACGDVPAFTSDSWSSEVHDIDIWMGCSPELIQILGSITELIRLKRKDPAISTEESFVVKTASLEYQLEHLVQTVHGDDDSIILQSAELKRLAATLYLHCTLYDAGPSTSLVVEQVREILQSVSSCLVQGLGASLTWPIFVAAVELDPLDDMIILNGQAPSSGRAFVLTTLAAMSTSAVGNLARTRSVITDVWQRRDLAQLKKPHDVSDGPQLSDWEVYVAPASINLSLA